jgi:hypothetical protein
LVEGVDLVVIRYGDAVSVLFGRCLHRGALQAALEHDGPSVVEVVADVALI